MNNKDKIKTECIHFPLCGGCDFLDLDYTKELKRKDALIHELFSEYRHVNIKPTLPSPISDYYRNKIQLPFGRRVIGQKVVLNLGLFNRDSSFVVDQTECKIQDQGLTEIVIATKQWARREKLLPYNEKSRRGFLKYLVARKSKTTGEILLGIVTAKEDIPHAKDASKRLFTEIQNRIGKTGKFGKLVGIVQNFNPKHTTMALGKEENLLWGRPYIKEQIGPWKFRAGLSTFLQVNPTQTPTLYNVILDQIAPQAKVIDAYSGIGTISLWISNVAKEVLGIEENPNSHRTALEACKFNHVKNVRFRKGRVADVLPTVLNRGFDTLVLDPPRVGLGEEVIQSILYSEIQKLVYVSCDPQTLKDDTRRLTKEYYLDSLQPVDLFPRTKHVETVAVFQRKEKLSKDKRI